MDGAIFSNKPRDSGKKSLILHTVSGHEMRPVLVFYSTKEHDSGKKSLTLHTVSGHEMRP